MSWYTLSHRAGTNYTYIRWIKPCRLFPRLEADGTGWLETLDLNSEVFSLVVVELYQMTAGTDPEQHKNYTLITLFQLYLLALNKEKNNCSPNACCSCVSDEMKVAGLVQFRWRHSDGAWTQMDSSSWQLRSFFFFFLVFYRTRTEKDLKCSLEQDQARSHFSSKPQTQTGREQSNRRETTLVQGQLHSSVEPKEMENYSSGNVTENSSHSQKILHRFSDRECFLLLWFSYLGGQWSLKTHSLCFSVPIHRFCQNVNLRWLMSPVRAPYKSKLESVLFFLWFYKNISVSRRGHFFFTKLWLLVLVELPADQITLIEYIWKSIMSGKPETQAPFGHLNLPQRPVGDVVRFSKAASVRRRHSNSRDTDWQAKCGTARRGVKLVTLGRQINRQTNRDQQSGEGSEKGSKDINKNK